MRRGRGIYDFGELNPTVQAVRKAATKYLEHDYLIDRLAEDLCKHTGGYFTDLVRHDIKKLLQLRVGDYRLALVDDRPEYVGDDEKGDVVRQLLEDGWVREVRP